MTRPPLLLHVFSTFATGGPQLRFAALANHFGLAYRHAVLAMDGNIACRSRLAPGLAVTFPDNPLRKGETVENIRRIRRLLRSLRPDLLVTNNWGTIEWAIANAVLLVPHLHIEDGFGPEERARQIPRRAIARRLFLRRSAVLLPSHTLYRIATDVWRLPRARLHYIPNGIDVARFAPRATNGQAPWPGEGPVVGTVAGLRPEKNVSRLIAAFAQLKRPARLVIVGDGPERKKLEAEAAALGLADRAIFVGQAEDPAAMYPRFDLFALSSDTEQMPLSLLEAMASGLAVVATDVGDIRDIVADDNRCFIVPRDDNAAFAGAMERLLDEHTIRLSLGRKNRDRVTTEFSQERMFAAYSEIFQTVRERRPMSFRLRSRNATV